MTTYTKLFKRAHWNSGLSTNHSVLTPVNLVISESKGTNEGKTLVYLDPGFRLGRHYVNMAETLSADCRSRGLKLRHYVGINVPDFLVEKYSLQRFFADYSQHDKRTEKQSQFLAEMRAIVVDVISTFGHDKQFVFYMYCGTLSHFLAIGEVASLSCYAHVNMKFYVNLSYQDLNSGKSPEEYAEDLKIISNVWESHDKASRIIGIMDNRLSIERYQSCFNRKIEFAPIPLYKQQPKLSDQNRRCQLITVGYFGQLEEEQGYLLAARTYEEFIEKRKQSGLEFLMRVNNNSGAGHLVQHFKDFRGKTNRLSVIEGFVNRDRYFDLMSKCDIVILPYIKERYPYRTSGVFTDAVICQKAVVVPKDTWMEEMLSWYGFGTTFQSGDLDSLIEALDWVIEEFSDLKCPLARNVNHIYEQFCSSTLLDKIFVE